VSVLTLIPKRWMSRSFIVSNGSSPVADVNLSGSQGWREKGLLTVEGVGHQVYREVYGDGAMSGDFVLERDGTLLARAMKPSAFRSVFVLEYERKQYTLRKSAWTRKVLLLDDERVLGTLSPESPWTRRTTVVLPDNWPLPVKVFVAWLAIVLRRRALDE
jgi:hypothetical protein